MKTKNNRKKIKYITHGILLLIFILLVSITYSQTNSTFLSAKCSNKIYILTKGNDFYSKITLTNKKLLKITLPFVFTSSKYNGEYIIHTDYIIFFKNMDTDKFKKIKEGPFTRGSEVGKSVSFTSYKKNILVYIPESFLSNIGMYKVKFTIDFYTKRSKKIYKVSSDWINIKIK